MHRDYADPTCTTQTRLGTFHLSPHVAHPGGRLTGTVALNCKCPIDWSGLTRLTLGGFQSPLAHTRCGRDDTTCTVTIPKKASTARYSIVTVGITNEQGTGISKDYFAVVGGNYFQLAGHVTDQLAAPIADLPVLISGPGVEERKQTDATGLYSALLAGGRYVVAVGRKGLKPVKSGDCQVVEKTCHVYLIQDRTADFEINAPRLIFSAKLGAEVHSPTHHRLIQAGTPFLIHVTLRNTSREKRLLVYPTYGQLSGNASDGHLQPAGESVRVVTPDGSLDEVRPSPYIVLQPKQTREFDVVVRTTASNAFAEEGQSAAGGTHAVVRLAPPEVAELPEGDLMHIDPAQLTKLDPAKAVEMEEGSREFTVGIDESVPEPPPYSTLASSWYITKGLVIGLWRATWGLARGLVWDLPKLVVTAVASVPSATLAYLNYEAELWDSIKNNPDELALFLNPLTHHTLLAAKEAPFLVQNTQDLYNQINQAVSAHFNKMERDWYAGDWRQAETDLSADVGEGLGNVALLAAPGMLARAPAVVAKWNAAKVALFGRVGEELATAAKAETTAAEADRALAAIEEARTAEAPAGALGLPLSNTVLLEDFGLDAAQSSWLRAYAKAKKLIITLKSRAQQSLKWIAQAARLKPSWIKVKTVNWLDVKYLGYSEGDIGRLVIHRPPTRAEFFKTFEQIPQSERKEAVRRWLLRTKEYTTEEPGYVKQLREWTANGKVEGEWPFDENLTDPNHKANEVETRGFRLEPNRQQPGDLIVEVESPLGSGKWVSVTGDVDVMSITHADLSPLSDAEHVDVLNDLRAGIDLQHPETATWTGNGPAREKILENGGKCCFAQFAPTGEALAVKYDRGKSFFENPAKYRVWYDGGYFVPDVP